MTCFRHPITDDNGPGTPSTLQGVSNDGTLNYVCHGEHTSVDFPIGVHVNVWHDCKKM